MPTRPGRPMGLAILVSLLLGMLPDTGVTAQMPGGSSVDFGRERAVFRATVLAQIRPVMDAWQGAWRGDVGPTVESFYTPDAVVAVRDSLMGGRRTLAAFLRSARRGVAGVTPSLLDFEASEGLAYVYGAWSGTAAQGNRTAGGAVATGRLLTVLRKNGRTWTIRSQLFSTDSVAERVLGAVKQVEPMPSLERRVAVGSRAVVPTKPGESERQDTGARRRIAVYRELISTLAGVRRAWNADDTEALASLMRTDAWVQLPGVGDWAGRATATELKGVLPRYGSLHTVEMDFDYGGALAYLSGRYYVERSPDPPKSGSYIAVFQNLGSGWLIRSLAFF